MYFIIKYVGGDTVTLNVEDEELLYILVESQRSAIDECLLSGNKEDSFFMANGPRIMDKVDKIINKDPKNRGVMRVVTGIDKTLDEVCEAFLENKLI
jgi:hypothetical protein